MKGSAHAVRFFVLILIMWGQPGWQPLTAKAAEIPISATRGNAKAVAQVTAGEEFLIQLDPALHKKFGLFYPATYKFRLPAGAHGLVAQFRYSNGAWSSLPEKRSGELFNGIDAVRFDYVNGFAYLSARFSLSDDNLFLRVLDSAGAPVSLLFDSIPKYYDDRKGAVAITVDDWNFAFDAPFRKATDYLASLNLYFTVALIAADIPWASVQEKMNQYGTFMELASHSLHHPCSATAYQVSGYEAETAGSRDAITGNLTFPNYPYVTAYIEPCGYSDSSLYAAISSAGYLAERSSNDSFNTAARFIEWDPFQGRYGKAGVTYNDTAAGDTPLLLAEANAVFDKAMAAGGIYSLEDHPYNGYWHDGSYLLQHLNYVKGRSDLWYVPFGQMYQYHFLQEMRGNLSIKANTTVPAAPTIASIQAVNGQAEISFAAPVTGGSPITSYTVTASPGNIMASAMGSPITVAGLSNGTVYTFTVSATNAVGAGPASAPFIVPWPPINGTVASMAPAASAYGPGGGTGQVTVTASAPWSAVTGNGWITITSAGSFANSGTLSYTVSGNGTGHPRTGTIAVGNQYFTVRQSGNDFSDITDPSAWFYPYVNSIYATGITKGCGSNDFCPGDAVTREQMAAFVIRALKGENFTYTVAPFFIDVPAASWSYPYVQKMKDLGLTQNTGSYDPSGIVTREQAATFIIRALYGENFPYPAAPYFSDVPSSAWSFKYVQKLKELGLTTNTGTYDPAGTVTRAQMATFISRAFLGMMPSSAAVPSNNVAFTASIIVGKSFQFPVPNLGPMTYTFDINGTFSATSSGAMLNKSYSGNWMINSDGSMTLNNVQGMTPGYTESYIMVGGGGVFPPVVNFTSSNGSSGTNLMMTVN